MPLFDFLNKSRYLLLLLLAVVSSLVMSWQRHPPECCTPWLLILIYRSSSREVLAHNLRKQSGATRGSLCALALWCIFSAAAALIEWAERVARSVCLCRAASSNWALREWMHFTFPAASVWFIFPTWRLECSRLKSFLCWNLRERKRRESECVLKNRHRFPLHTAKINYASRRGW